MLIDKVLGASEVWAAWVVTVTWQLAALAVVGWACESVLRLRQPGARYGLWWFVLVAPLVLGPARMALERMEAVVRVAPPAVVEQAVTRVRMPAPIQPRILNMTKAGTPLGDGLWGTQLQTVDLVALLWALACLALAARLGVGHAWARRLVVESRLVTDGDVLGALAELCAEAGVRQDVHLRVSPSVGAPLLYGARRPTILLPADYVDALAPDDLRALLAHEVAHVRRGDCLANLVQRLVEIPLFFHPGAWLASRQVTLAREELADGWALARGVEAGRYARSLTAAAERAQGRLGAASVGVAENRSMLQRRVETIMATGKTKRVSGFALAALVAVVVTAAVLAGVVAMGSEPSDAGSGQGVGANVVLPPEVNAEADKVVSNMKNVVLGVIMYVADHEGTFPAAKDTGELRDMIEAYVKSPQMFMRPGSREELAMRYVIHPGTAMDSLENPATTPILVSDYHRDFRVVGYADGHVELNGEPASARRQEERPEQARKGDRASWEKESGYEWLQGPVRSEALEVNLNLKKVVLALHMWAADHDGKLPPANDVGELKKILSRYVKTQRVFTRPGSDTKVAFRFTFEPGAQIDPSAHETVIAVADYRPEFRVVGYMDGHVILERGEKAEAK